ncbi:unnamed protein product [Brugia pahangi]|uniref:Uncharacterized protein n=1 Tax=Brugia pahangi TaxID=6280 RepID=A0A0N4TRT0_BRUPA|nr:unnamed protein product [Brugia pahangi]
MFAVDCRSSRTHPQIHRHSIASWSAWMTLRAITSSMLMTSIIIYEQRKETKRSYIPEDDNNNIFS